MKVAIFGNVDKKGFAEVFYRLVSALERNGAEIVVLDRVREKHDYERVSPGQRFSADLVFSIGGDGTFITTATELGDNDIPVMGIKLGNLGFLADVQSDDIDAAIDDIFANGFSSERRSLLRVSVGDESWMECNSLAMNEIAVLKRDTASMLKVHATVGGEYLCEYRADGLIVATPSGSTAYSLSVGGPILYPTNNDMIITPVAPHSLTLRPVVIPDDMDVELDVEGRTDTFMLSVDGRAHVLKNGTHVSIRKASESVLVAKLRSHTFFKTLREKLMLGADVRLK